MTGRRIRLSSTLAAAVAIMLAAASVQANAFSDVSLDGDLRGGAAFLDSGDWFVICDEYRDDLPVAVRYSYIRKDGTTQRGTHWHRAGVDGLGNRGPNGPARGCSFGNHDFAENGRVWFHACVGHAGGALTCSKTEVTEAGLP